jgi:hypothetical protein
MVHAIEIFTQTSEGLRTRAKDFRQLAVRAFEKSTAEMLIRMATELEDEARVVDSAHEGSIS